MDTTGLSSHLSLLSQSHLRPPLARLSELALCWTANPKTHLRLSGAVQGSAADSACSALSPRSCQRCREPGLEPVSPSVRPRASDSERRYLDGGSRIIIAEAVCAKCSKMTRSSTQAAEIFILVLFWAQPDLSSGALTFSLFTP